MTLNLRDELDELEGYVSAVALASGIPVSHVEKDFWVTEALRGIADASQATGCSVIFKGGTSLSKAHRLIQRFSEDVDLLVVLPSGGKKSRDSILKEFAAAAESETGLQGTTEAATTTTGVKRTVNLHYPARFSSVSLKSDVVMEIGSRGGAIPSTLLGACCTSRVWVGGSCRGGRRLGPFWWGSGLVRVSLGAVGGCLGWFGGGWG